MKWMHKYYSPDSLPGVGQEPTGEGQEPTPAEDKAFDAKYVEGLRAEAARYRNEAKAAKSQLSELQPLAEKARQLEDANKSEAEKLAQKLADMQAQLNAAQADAARAAAERKLTTLAVKAGVSGDILPFLDVSKFDLENEETTLATLAKLKTPTPANGGGPSNPGRSADSNGQLSPADWYKQATGKTPSIFGGK
jgi:multidrug efflux pump subunit AcrA (membrane-fusion protein)